MKLRLSESLVLLTLAVVSVLIISEPVQATIIIGVGDLAAVSSGFGNDPFWAELATFESAPGGTLGLGGLFPSPFAWLDYKEKWDIVIGNNDSPPVWEGNNDSPFVFDFFTVVLHEIGHALALPHSSNQNDIMFANYISERTTLGSSDIQAIQFLYGTPTLIHYEFGSLNGYPNLITGAQKNLAIQALNTWGAAANIDFVQIPEPSSFVLFALGVLSVALYSWQRRKQMGR